MISTMETGSLVFNQFPRKQTIVVRVHAISPLCFAEAMILGEGLRIPIVGFICQPDHKIEAGSDETMETYGKFLAELSAHLLGGIFCMNLLAFLGDFELISIFF